MSDAHGNSEWNPSYLGQRTDILSLIHEDEAPETVLDVGCATGANGIWIKNKYASRVVGLEFDPSMAEVAGAHYDRVHQVDLNKELPGTVVGEQRYDLILCGDILEHLADPWAVLMDLKMLLAPSGYILVSLPNINHFSIIFSLTFLGEWRYKSRGILDKTHLRFFTRKSIYELFNDCGLVIEKEKRNLRLIESGSPLNRLAFLCDFYPLRRFFVFQYIHRIRPG